MASKTATKGGKPAGKGGTVKTPGKDQIKSDKPPTNVLEIVPGKFNETDWTSLLENDETEDYIADIFDDIWSETSKQIQQIYARKQLVPFTLTIVEHALTNIIQWAFLERDEPRPADGDFWMEDDEPIACTMDNWGEGVVPSCREEQPQSEEESPLSVVESSPSPLINHQTPEETDQRQRSSSSSSHSDTQRNEVHKTDNTPQENETKSATDDHYSSEKETSIKQKPYNHDILVIETQPPKLEPLANLFNSVQIETSSSSPYSTPISLKAKRRKFIAPKASSQLGSDALASTTNITDTTKSTKKIESKLFDDQHIEEIISKAPVAAQSMLKSILSRPPGYRELELDDHGNVIAIAKLDPDKLASRSIRVQCDIVKPKRALIENRSIPKQSQSMKVSRSEPKFAPVKLTLPDHSTAVGDLIHPVPGVLYEDSKLKKGDPRRYKNGMSKYTNFYDETRPLRPIAPKGDLAVLQLANELLRKSKENNERGRQTPELNRFVPIPPIRSSSNTSFV